MRRALTSTAPFLLAALRTTGSHAPHTTNPPTHHTRHSIPVIGGYYVMEWAQNRARENLGPNNEVLRRANGRGDLSTEAQNKHLQAVLTDIEERAKQQRESR